MTGSACNKHASTLVKQQANNNVHLLVLPNVQSHKYLMRPNTPELEMRLVSHGLGGALIEVTGQKTSTPIVIPILKHQ